MDKLRIIFIVLVAICYGQADAQSWNSWQPLPPNNYRIRTGATVNLPDAPANLVAVVTTGGINLSWDTVAAADSYEVFRSTDGTDFSFISDSSGLTTFTDDSAASGTEYVYKVSCYDIDGNDSYGSAVSPWVSDDGFSNRQTITGYFYGYPTYGAAESNVVAQWLFDEYWDNFTGIAPNVGGGGYFRNASVTGMDLGTSSGVLELVSQLSEGGGAIGDVDYVDLDMLNASGYGIKAYNFGHSAYRVIVTANDGTSVTFTPSHTRLDNGQVHKWRIVFDRAGNEEIFLDNVSLGTSSLATLAGKTVPISEITMGATRAGANIKNGVIYEARYTVGNTSNDSGGPGSGTSPYNYGSSSSSGVKFHYKMQEASGNITSSASDATVLTVAGTPTFSKAGAGKAAAIYDEVSGIKLTYNGSYDANQAATGDYAGLSPGMKNTSTAPTHVSAAGTASLDWTCNDGMTFEAWFKSTTNTAGQYWGLYTEGNGENANLRAYYFYTGASPTFAFYLISSDSTSKLWTPAVSTSVFDGNLHKLRLVVDPNGSGNGELFIDEVSQGTSTFAAFVGKTVTHELSRMGAIWASNSVTSNTTIYEVRESHNITNNSGE